MFGGDVEGRATKTVGCGELGGEEEGEEELRFTCATVGFPRLGGQAFRRGWGREVPFPSYFGDVACGYPPTECSI